MIHSTPHIDVTCDHGTATLWLRFPGRPVNALDLDRLRELESAIAAVESNDAIRVLVVRSGIPGGFCEGVHPEALASLTTAADAASFAWYVQRVFTRLATLEIPTVAFIDGACRNEGFGLALACDYRLALANPLAPIAFTWDRLLACHCDGPLERLMKETHPRSPREGSDRLEACPTVMTARQAVAHRLVDQAFCERRAKIELRSFLDSLERNPVKPRRRWSESGFAEQRRTFIDFVMAQDREEFASPPQDVLRPSVVGILPEHATLRRLAANLAVQGTTVLLPEQDEHSAGEIEDYRQRGFLTPLEAEHARRRIVETNSVDAYCQAGLVFASNSIQAAAVECVMNPAGLIAVEDLPSGCLNQFDHPQRVVEFGYDGEGHLTFFAAAARAEHVSSILASLGLMACVNIRPNVESVDIRSLTPPRSLAAA